MGIVGNTGVVPLCATQVFPLSSFRLCSALLGCSGPTKKFLRKPPYHAPSSFSVNFLTTGPSISPSRGPSGNLQPENPTTSPSSDPTQKFPRKPSWPVLSTYPGTAQANFHNVNPATLLFQTLSHHIPFHTPILTPILITHHLSFHLPHPYSISHIGYTMTPWAATQVKLQLYSSLDPTPGSSPVFSHVYSRVQGLRRNSKPSNSHSLLCLSL